MKDQLIEKLKELVKAQHDFIKWMLRYNSSPEQSLRGQEFLKGITHAESELTALEQQEKEPKDWLQIEREFVEWDNATHSNASQRQIMDWFKERFNQSAPTVREELIKLVRIARAGAHYTSGNSTYWRFDIDREKDVIEKYLSQKHPEK